MLRALALLLLAAAAPRSCGDGGSSSDGAAGEPAKPSPVAECQTYANTWCNKALGCYVQVGRIDQDTAQTDIEACVQETAGRWSFSRHSPTSWPVSTTTSRHPPRRSRRGSEPSRNDDR